MARLPIVLALAALWLTGCGGSESQPPVCTDEGCGHGTCRDGRCVCDPGWQPRGDGLVCLPFTFDPCEGVDCSGQGTCAVVAVPPYGLEEPRCQCVAPAVPTPDGLDCVDPCAEVDCAPGSCASDADTGRARCECPLGYQAVIDPPACQLVDTYHYELIYPYEGMEYPLGRGWVRLQPGPDGLTLEAQSTHSIPISYSGSAGALYRAIARLDAAGRLREVSLDEQTTFGSVSARRHLAYSVQEEDGTSRLRQAANILERLWRTEREWSEAAPLPFAGGWEWPTFSYGCFDPLFYFLLGLAADLATAGESQLDVMIPSYGIPSRLPVAVAPGAGEGNASIELPWFGVRADYTAGVLARVEYGFGFWRPAAQAADLELNLRPLPLTPLLHEEPVPGELVEEEVAVEAGDGVTLAGALALPAGAPSGPAVLLAPDLLPNTRDLPHYHTRLYRALAEALAGAGIASLRLDGRGTGESGGDALADLARVEADLDAAHAWLAADGRFQGVVLLAHATTTPLALAAARRLPLRGLILIAPTGADFAADSYHLTAQVLVQAGLGDLNDYYGQDHAQRLAGLADGSVQEPLWGRSAAFWRAFLSRDPDDVAGIACPVLLLAGEDDPSVPIANVDALAAALDAQATPVQALRLPGVGHRLTPARLADLLEDYHLPWDTGETAPSALQGLVGWLASLP